MDLSKEQSRRFSELEYCFGRYFDQVVAPAMQEVQRDLVSKQAKELSDYQSSVAGIITMATDPTGGGPGRALQTLSVIGEWNSKTTDDYLDMCRKKLESSGKVGNDLGLLAGEWREQLIRTVGRERYDSMSEKLGTDMAGAYVGYRMERLMIDRLVQQKMPKSSLEYVLKKASDQSLLSLSYSLRQTAIDNEIEHEAERAYAPTQVEKGAGKILGFGMDTLVTGGCSTWANAGKVAVVNLLVDDIGESVASRREAAKLPTVEEYISQGVFQTQKNVINAFRNEASHIEAHESDYIQSLNGRLGGRLKVLSTEEKERLDKLAENFEPPQWKPEIRFGEQKRNPDIPMVIRPDKEEDYLKDKGGTAVSEGKEKEKRQSGEQVVIDEQVVVPPSAAESQGNGWGKLLGSVGLSDMGGIGRNLGYVLSMLPDLLVGQFTGKTKSLGLKANLLPIASILLGLFTKNPLLKMLLIGMGGMNLMNKAGHEAIHNKKADDGVLVEESSNAKREFKQYADEPLNTRIGKPEVKGSYLLATVDHVPCTIHIPDAVAAAYRAGALPLNTLANAVLAKSDEMQVIAQGNYAVSEERTARSRGVGG